MVVFQFTDDQDMELLRELIAAKPFSAPFGTAMTAWEAIAGRVSSAIGTVVNHKQIRDRLQLLMKKFKASESQSARSSGVEESMDASNVLSNYSDVLGLTREYIQLERVFRQGKAAVSDLKKAKDTSLNRCAVEIIRESTIRRADRGVSNAIGDEELSASGGSGNACPSTLESDSPTTFAGWQNDSDSSASIPTTQSTPSIPTSVRPTLVKRSNAFVLETRRQAKRFKTEISIRRSELSLQTDRAEAQERQFAERVAFERERAANRLEFERESQQLNRQLILECARLFSSAVALDHGSNSGSAQIDHGLSSARP